MEQDLEYRQQLVQDYMKMAGPLFRYLTWLESSAGASLSSTYAGQDITEHSMAFPVYDGTLMSFVREASKNPLMDRNYHYIYTRNHIKTPADERRMIEKATLKEWGILEGILSKYVLGGMTKSTLWTQGVEERIFYLTIKKMKYILEYWDKPIDNG